MTKKFVITENLNPEHFDIDIEDKSIKVKYPTMEVNGAGLMTSEDKDKIDNTPTFFVSETEPSEANVGDIWLTLEPLE